MISIKDPLPLLDISNSGTKQLLSTSLLVCVLMVAGTLYCLYFGRIGYMPQDHAAVFDGGYRLLCGQFFFRDFTASNAFIPVLLQAPFFYFFGLNWFAYCLHAAIFNGLFCIIAFFFLRMFGGSLLLSFLYALLSGIVFYPPLGIPVQDQHAFFFTLLLIFLSCRSIRAENPAVKKYIWFFLPLVTAIALLSKQIPTLFGAILAFLILVIGERKNAYRLACALFLGSLFVAALLVLLWYVAGIDYELVKVYFFQLPAGTAGERIDKILSGACMKVLLHIIESWRLFFPLAVVTLLFLAMLVCSIKLPKFLAMPALIQLRKQIIDNLFVLMLSQALLLICFVFVFLTNNQAENGVPFIFISMGLAHIFVQSVCGAEKSMGPVHRRPLARAVFLLAGFIFCVSSVWCAKNFHVSVNQTRMANDMFFNESDKNLSGDLPEMLSFMVWATVPEYSGTPGDFNSVINFFKSNPGNFFLIGDSSILYALTGRPSVNPVLWFHPGQTLPASTSPLFPAFEDLLMEKLRKFKVKYIVTENVRGEWTTWMEVSLWYFPRLVGLLDSKGSACAKFGPFTIYEIQPIGTM